MPKQKQADVTEAMQERVKDVARALMAERGTAGLSLRAIARDMNLTAPALYHYYPNLDALITALLVDAFHAIAEATRVAGQQAADAGQPPRAQLTVMAHAFRGWALHHRTDFQLVYGDPIPGYSAPDEVTAPAARQLGVVFMRPLVAAWQDGTLRLAAHTRQVPPGVAAHLRSQMGPGAADEPVALAYALNTLWPALFGMVTLEIHGHAAPVVGNTDAFFAAHIAHLLDDIGFAPMT